MNEKDIAEIRRRFRPDKSNISRVRGCYVNEKGEIVSEFNQSLSLMPDEEAEKILALLKRTLSGVLGKNLIDIVFDTRQVVDRSLGDEHHLLMTLRNSALQDEEAVQTFLQRVSQSLQMESGYFILLAHDTYDIPYRAKDGERLEDASSEVFSYFLCSICPVKVPKPALSYYITENAFHSCKPDWIVASPELGFLFPAFDHRSANIYEALYYSRSLEESHQELVDAVFRIQLPMPASAQKETFESLLENTLAEECRYEVVQTVREQLCSAIEEHKANHEEEPLVITKQDVKGVLASCGVSEERMDAFEEGFEEQFGADAEVPPRNIVDAKSFEVTTPNVTVRVKPEFSDLVSTRVIDGVNYILIRADEGVEVNGVNIHL